MKTEAKIEINYSNLISKKQTKNIDFLIFIHLIKIVISDSKCKFFAHLFFIIYKLINNNLKSKIYFEPYKLNVRQSEDLVFQHVKNDWR